MDKNLEENTYTDATAAAGFIADVYRQSVSSSEAGAVGFVNDVYRQSVSSDEDGDD